MNNKKRYHDDEDHHFVPPPYFPCKFVKNKHFLNKIWIILFYIFFLFPSFFKKHFEIEWILKSRRPRFGRTSKFWYLVFLQLFIDFFDFEFFAFPKNRRYLLSTMNLVVAYFMFFLSICVKIELFILFFFDCFFFFSKKVISIFFETTLTFLVGI